MLYEMLTGTTPFKSDDLIVILTRTITEPPPPLPESIPEPVRTLTMGLLRKLPEERLSSAIELIEQIDHIIGPSLPPPSSMLNPRSSQLLSPEPGPVSPESASGVAVTADEPALVPESAPAATLSGKKGFTLPPWLTRPIAVGRKLVPTWTLAAGGLVLMTLGAVGTCAVAGDDPTGTPAVAASGAAPVPTTQEEQKQAKLREAAEKGDQAALAQLEAKSARERTAEEWRAIGHGYCQIGQFSACIAKYRDGVTKRPALAKDPVVLADVRKAAAVPDAHREALELAALHLWAPGVDIVYDVWTSTKGDKASEDVNSRAKQFVEDGSIRAKASPELKVALDLQRALKKQDCATAKKTVKLAAEQGDVRAVPFLEQLRNTRGCGILSLGDCWSCLRGVVNVGDAIEASKKRAAPVYE